MQAIDRLSALDAAFLDLDTARAPLHVGWTMRFAGSPPTVAALRRHLDRRLDRVPRFRRRVAEAPGGRVWVDDPAFDIAHHVHSVSLPVPGGGAELRDTAGALLGRPLAADRPLWRLYVVDGLAGGGFAVVGQAHHALVDGIAAVEVAMLLFDAGGAATSEQDLHASWTPRRPRTAAATAVDAYSERARLAAGALAAVARTAAQPGRAAAGLRDAAAAVGAAVGPVPPTTLDRSATARRALAFATAPLDAVREAGRRRGATVNDVLLSASSLALGRALRRRGDHPASFRALVPVDVRGEAQAAALGNAISFMPVDLPVAETDPVRVLRLVRDRTRAAKASGVAGPLSALARAGDLLPGAGRRALVRAAVRAAPFNAVVSNVPGPDVDLELMGRRLLAVHPAVPLLDGHALSVGALSYAGRLHVGLYADADVLPDVLEVGRDVEAAFDALRLAGERSAARGATPWQQRARRRRARSAR